MHRHHERRVLPGRGERVLLPDESTCWWEGCIWFMCSCRSDSRLMGLIKPVCPGQGASRRADRRCRLGRMTFYLSISHFCLFLALTLPDLPSFAARLLVGPDLAFGQDYLSTDPSADRSPLYAHPPYLSHPPLLMKCAIRKKVDAFACGASLVK